MPDLQFILASTSPRRAQLLQSIGIPFTLAAVEVEEPLPESTDHDNPAGFVERLALLKASAFKVAPGRRDPAVKQVVLGADTVVWHQGRILNKPADPGEACSMLRRLNGDSHQVFTGICLRAEDETVLEHEVTTVTFSRVSDSWIDSYVATGEPLDKAGSYAAQGLGALLLARIEGDYWNVVGLPLARLALALGRLGVPVETWWQR